MDQESLLIGASEDREYLGSVHTAVFSMMVNILMESH